MKLYVKLLFLVGGWVAGGSEKTKLMLYSTLDEIEVVIVVVGVVGVKVRVHYFSGRVGWGVR